MKRAVGPRGTGSKASTNARLGIYLLMDKCKKEPLVLVNHLESFLANSKRQKTSGSVEVRKSYHSGPGTAIAPFHCRRML